MPVIEPDPLPPAYLRLLAAQRTVPPEERAEIEKEQARESAQNRLNRRYPKVY